MKPLKFIKTSLIIALFTLGFTGFSFGQTDQTEEAEADEAGAITEVKLQDQAKAKRDKTAVAIQKDHLKQNILEEIEQVNDALYIIEVKMKERQKELEGKWMSAVKTLERI
ncbi:MAG: hypothetical protein HUJ25_01380 [Crocinitomicaceae bacterium]|nr:hypothetical protein [Crocinitomicaceae bacterium]